MDEQTQLRIHAMQMAIDYTKDTPDADLTYWATVIYDFITNTEQK